MKLKFPAVGLALAAALGAAAAGGVADAKPLASDLLATQIQDALSRIGCSATTEQDILAIQSVIAASGASPAEAEAALRLARSFRGCGGDAAAIASVSNTISLALANSDPAGGPGSGLGGGGPIGAPPIFVGAEAITSNYSAP